MEVIEPGFYYHIYNHANGDEDNFKEERNYQYFLDKYKKYIHPIAETFAYCLMKNHFHLLVRIREKDEIGYYKKLNSVRSDDPDRFQTTLDLSDPLASGLTESVEPKRPNPTKHFSHLFNSYSKYFNKTYERHGSLFVRPFKRKQMQTDKQFQNALIYIHMNPIIHSFCDKPEQWKYSSYNAYIKNNSKTLVNVQKGIEWFDNLQNFIKCHTSYSDDGYSEL